MSAFSATSGTIPFCTVQWSTTRIGPEAAIIDVVGLNSENGQQNWLLDMGRFIRFASTILAVITGALFCISMVLYLTGYAQIAGISLLIGRGLLTVCATLLAAFILSKIGRHKKGE